MVLRCQLYHLHQPKIVKPKDKLTRVTASGLPRAWKPKYGLGLALWLRTNSCATRVPVSASTREVRLYARNVRSMAVLQWCIRGILVNVSFSWKYGGWTGMKVEEA